MPVPNCSIRKRQPISLDEKKAIIEEARTKSVPEVAVHFNRKYPESTIRTFLKDKEKILKTVEEGAESKRARIRAAKHSDLNEALLRWFKDVRSQNIPVDTHTLKAKAVELARMLDIGDFNASEGWASRFKSRHGILFKQVQGEAGDVDMEAVSDWHQTVLFKELEQFSEENVFNVDETGDRCTSGKRSKERITVLVGSNMSGTETVPLLVIGKSRSPRCFKNASVPVDYEANHKAWMTAEIFERWIKMWDRRLGKENRKILLFVDNCPAHPKVTLTNIALRFFLPNATAEVQPMDQGIMQNLKIHYRRLFLRRRIASIDSSVEFSFDFLNPINLLDQAWSEVKPETLKNCFRKASFLINDEVRALLNLIL
ncbi:unnamed protein product [Heligmosomoides polygyrus]|uniref:HTH CENPB-type domain-containing protein n=1 Tax=Heligmosomoides polygyrus TaxID=6339 RepID=A0A183G1H3_HELPZ|nr:unnamed protein product [Heligmosomoides polygyrus]